ncbi:MFS transporter [Streptomyces monticola]|uniref:MFS transporter n=1 Tax=Streptomyces monticola TaxID=2666263 RepID=A0ABW2JUK4_9ACTN
MDTHGAAAAAAPTAVDAQATRPAPRPPSTSPPPPSSASPPSSPVDGPALRPLLCTQVVGALGLSAGGTASPFLAADILGSAALTTLPFGLLVLGTAGSAPLISAVMRRHGRAVGLALAYAVATAGTFLVIAAAATGGAALLFAGSLLSGTGNTAVMLGRYVAADAAPPGRAGRAVSTVMTAVTFGAVIGPMLMGPTEAVAHALGLPGATGLFLLAAVTFPTAAVVTLRQQLKLRSSSPPVRGRPDTAATATRSRTQARTRPRVPLLALAILGCANLTMVTAMAAAPVHLHAHHWSLDAIGLLVGAHVALMFGPSVLSGRLTDRIGAGLTALTGATVLLLALPLVALTSTGAHWATIAGLLLLGLGWNILLISGSALVIQRTPAAHRHRTEGLGETSMALGAVLGTVALAGPLIAVGGVPLLCLALGAITALAAVFLLRDLRR